VIDPRGSSLTKQTKPSKQSKWSERFFEIAGGRLVYFERDSPSGSSGGSGGSSGSQSEKRMIGAATLRGATVTVVHDRSRPGGLTALLTA
jgi:hypothetical protein